MNKGLLILELQVLTEIEIKLNKYFGKTTQFLIPFFFSLVPKPSLLYSLFIDAPLIAFVVASAELY